MMKYTPRVRSDTAPVAAASSPASSAAAGQATRAERSEEHTSELQSPDHLVCRLLLEKKKKKKKQQLADEERGEIQVVPDGDAHDGIETYDELARLVNGRRSHRCTQEDMSV